MMLEGMCSCSYKDKSQIAAKIYTLISTQRKQVTNGVIFYRNLLILGQEMTTLAAATSEVDLIEYLGIREQDGSRSRIASKLGKMELRFLPIIYLTLENIGDC